MERWPNIKEPAWPIKEEIEDAALRSEAENGLVMSRAKFSRQREKFTLIWTALSTQDYNALKAFYKAMLGGSSSFAWSHPVTGKEYTVRFGAELKFSNDGPNIWSGSVELSEV